MSADASQTTARAVGEFYSQLVFPSRTSHPEYAEFVPERMGERIADFGCGQSIFYETLRRYSPAPVFLDLSAAALATIDYGARVRGDLYQLPFCDRAFDRIFCVGVLHHLPEPGNVLREIARVLAPDGLLVLGVYAPGTIQARLRRLYDLSAMRAWRRSVFTLTSVLVRARHARAGRQLASTDVQARVRDFLEVPLVRYVAPDYYVDLATGCGLRLRSLRRVSGMNLLVLDSARPR